MEWFDKLLILSAFIALIYAGLKQFSKDTAFMSKMVDHIGNLTEEIRALKKDKTDDAPSL